MFRMSRFDWLAQFFRHKPRVRAERPKREQKVPRRWELEVAGLGLLRTVAHTKSEARSEFKRELGVVRLAPGSEVKEVVP